LFRETEQILSASLYFGGMFDACNQHFKLNVFGKPNRHSRLEFHFFGTLALSLLERVNCRALLT
jgi:hypothetical protein